MHHGMQDQGPEDAPEQPQPTLSVTPARGTTRAVVLVLHGGRAMSREVAMARNLAVLRMVPFAWAVRRRVRRRGVAVWRLRYRYRGWNGADAAPVQDARWALEEVRRRHGDVPVVLLGHSMGGRTATHVADDPAVVGLVGLAPWITPTEPVDTVAGVVVGLLHGDQDRITSPAATAGWARAAEPHARRLHLHLIEGGEHFMLRHWRRWHRTAADHVVEALAEAGVLEPEAAAAG